jgi:hypothetical protein
LAPVAVEPIFTILQSKLAMRTGKVNKDYLPGLRS